MCLSSNRDSESSSHCSHSTVISYHGGGIDNTSSHLVKQSPKHSLYPFRKSDSFSSLARALPHSTSTNQYAQTTLQGVPAIQPSPSISDGLSSVIRVCVCLLVPHRTRMELAVAVALQPGASMQGASSSMIIQNLSYLQHATLPPCSVSTICTPLAKLAFISCCYRGTSPPNRSAITADRASGASSWRIWLASRAALRPEKENAIDLRAFVLIIKPLIPASCLQCFVSILCFNHNQTHTPTHTHKNRGFPN